MIAQGNILARRISIVEMHLETVLSRWDIQSCPLGEIQFTWYTWAVGMHNTENTGAN